MGNITDILGTANFVKSFLDRQTQATLDASLKERIAKSLVDRAQNDPVAGRAAIIELLNHITDLQHQNNTLSKNCLTDCLTGAHNERSFHQMMKKILKPAAKRERRRQGQHYIVMIDLDGFKKINDAYGHEVGNKALCHVVKELKKRTRSTDAVCRIGGDEFIVILRGATKEGALNKIISISDAFDTMSFDHEGIAIPVRASLGWTEIRCDVFVKDILKKIDDYVYEAKRIKGESRFADMVILASSFSAPDRIQTTQDRA